MGQLAYQLAYDAIEEYVAEHHEDDSGIWLEIVPGEVWGHTAEGWEPTATRIVNRFNDRLPVGSEIDVPSSAKRNSRTRMLIDFRRYLAAKADELNVSPAIVDMEG